MYAGAAAEAQASPSRDAKLTLFGFRALSVNHGERAARRRR